MPPNREDEFLPRAVFASAITSSQLLGLGVMAMVGIWLGKYRGGFAWDGTDQQFNYHPLFMVIGVVFLNAEGIMYCSAYNSLLGSICKKCSQVVP